MLQWLYKLKTNSYEKNQSKSTQTTPAVDNTASCCHLLYGADHTQVWQYEPICGRAYALPGSNFFFHLAQTAVTIISSPTFMIARPIMLVSPVNW
jgi:hypothetical protein